MADIKYQITDVRYQILDFRWLLGAPLTLDLLLGINANGVAVGSLLWTWLRLGFFLSYIDITDGSRCRGCAAGSDGSLGSGWRRSTLLLRELKGDLSLLVEGDTQFAWILGNLKLKQLDDAFCFLVAAMPDAFYHFGLGDLAFVIDSISDEYRPFCLMLQGFLGVF